MIPVSVVVVTKNEEQNIGKALESARDASEIIVIDSFSADRTYDICKRYTDRVFQKEWQGYAKQKQAAVDLAANNWVLILDADERITPELKIEITEAIRENRADGFFIPRKNFFLGKWIRHSGWWPDYTLRLFKKNAGHVEERAVHEKVVINGNTAFLKNPFEHFTYSSLSEFIKKTDNYSSLAAQELSRSGIAALMFGMLISPIATFLKMFFLRLGFLDGVYGLILASLYSYYTFLKYAKTWEMRNKKT